MNDLDEWFLSVIVIVRGTPFREELVVPRYFSQELNENRGANLNWFHALSYIWL